MEVNTICAEYVTFVSEKDISADIFHNMTEAMIRRGPNTGGLFRERIKGKYVGLGYRKFSIFDILENGKQPMVSEVK